MSGWQYRPEQDFSWSFRRAQRRNLTRFLWEVALGLLFIFVVAVPVLACGYAWVLFE